MGGTSSFDAIGMFIILGIIVLGIFAAAVSSALYRKHLMNKTNAPQSSASIWKKEIRASKTVSVLAGLGIVAGFVIFTIQTSHSESMPGSVSELFEDAQAGTVILAVSLIMSFVGSKIEQSAALKAYKALLPQEQNITRLAQIFGDNPALLQKRLTYLVRAGKLDAYVDKEKGVVVLNKPDGTEQPAKADTQPIPPLEPPKAASRGPVTVRCAGCGAPMDLKPGESAVCEYCGARMQGQ